MSLGNQVLQLLEEMGNIDFRKTCAYRFKNELRHQLVDAGLPAALAQAVVVAMPVKMPPYGIPDEWLQTAAHHYCKMVLKYWETFHADNWPDPESATIECARLLNLELE